MGKLTLSSESSTPSTPSDGCTLYVDNSNPPRIKFVDEAANAYYILFTGSAPGAALLTSGAWTPALTIGGSTTGIVSTVAGAYYRIGNMVYVEGSITLTNKGSNSGAVEITGLPVSAKVNSLPVCQLRSAANLASITDQIFMPITLQKIALYQLASGSSAALTDANLANNSALSFAGWYQVA